MAPPPLTPPQKSAYQVGAYYHVWYPDAFHHGYLRGELEPAQLPLPGEYSSWNPEVAELHISQASQHGIDFFCLDFWPGWPEYEERIQSFLEAPNISDIKFCVFFETQGLGYRQHLDGTTIGDEELEYFRSEIAHIGREYLSHPQYLKIDGRPVLVLYLTRTMFGKYREAIQAAREVLKEQGHDVYLIGDEMYWGVMPEEATDPEGHPSTVMEPQAGRIRQFDAVTAYNFYWSTQSQHAGYGAASQFLEDVSALTRRYREATEGEIPVIPSVIPGYNDRGFRLWEHHYPIPREWRVGSGPGSFFTRMLEDYAIPAIDRRAPFLFVTSWNEWNEDTGIEPLREASPTRRDSKQLAYTRGYLYSGHGDRYLKVLQSSTVSITGRVVDAQERPVKGQVLSLWSEQRRAASVSTDTRGYYNFSRLTAPEGDYLVGPSWKQARRVRVAATGSTQLDFQVASEALSTTPADGEQPQPEYQLREVGKRTLFLLADGSQDSLFPQPPVVDVLRRLLSPGDQVLEYGAGPGGYTGTMADEVGSSGVVHALESRWRSQLARNLSLFDSGNVQVGPLELTHAPSSLSSEGFTYRQLKGLEAFDRPELKLIKVGQGEPALRALYATLPLLEHQRPWFLVEVPEGQNPTSLREKHTFQSFVFALSSLGYRAWRFHQNTYLCGPMDVEKTGALLDVGTEAARVHIRSGFRKDERERIINYSWVNDQVAALELSIPSPAKGDYKLGVGARAYLPIQPVEMEVTVNGHPLGLMKFDERWRGLELPLKRAWLKQGKNRVELRCPGASSPAELGLSSDERRLGVAIDRVWLAPERFEP